MGISAHFIQVRWHETLTSLQSQRSTVIGDALLSSACLVYTGLFTPSYRQSLLGKWMHFCQDGKLPADSKFVMESSMSESDQVQVNCSRVKHVR